MEEVRPVKAGWYNAFRPWTLHGAVVPVLIGGAVAYHHMPDSFNPAIFILILIGGCLLQSAANLLNTYGDFEKGIDTEENHTRSPELVTGALRPRSVLYAGVACLGITALLGLIFIWYSGPEILIIGLAGMAAAGLYTVGVAYKYRGLGQISVFVMMGLLMPLGTYFVLTYQFSPDPAIVGLPNAFFIAAVLCGNEMRDFRTDLEAGIGTLCGRIGYERGLKLYWAENTLPYAILVIVVAAGLAPWTALAAFASLGLWYKLIRNSRKAEDDRRAAFMMVPAAFKLNWVFGALLTAGYLIGIIFL
ncbi:MAG: prenyltransferase [Candidatus Methanomethylophilaceae archaeon]|nr:prenyltransferase [Candidatus Methanomethylophilaceae archaeon]